MLIVINYNWQLCPIHAFMNNLYEIALTGIYLATRCGVKHPNRLKTVGLVAVLVHRNP